MYNTDTDSSVCLGIVWYDYQADAPVQPEFELVSISIGRHLVSNGNPVTEGTDIQVLAMPVTGSSADPIDVGTGTVSDGDGTISADWDASFQAMLNDDPSDYVGANDIIHLAIWYDSQSDYGFAIAYYVGDPESVNPDL